MNIFATKPYKAVSYVESAVNKALENCGYLIADVKYDGVRGNILVDNVADAAWLSRVGKLIPSLEHLNGFDARWKALLNDDRCIFPDGFMLDGELMVKGVDFNTASGLLRTKWLKATNWMHAAEFCNNALMPVNSKGKCPKLPFYLAAQKLQVRLYAAMPMHIAESGEDYDVQNLLMPYHVEAIRELLVEYFPEIEWLTAETFEVYDMESLVELYEDRRAKGDEGLIIKDPQGIYKRGKKSGWWKMKPEGEADGEIVGLVWGTEGLANEGKVIGFEVLLETGRVVNACNMTQGAMEDITERVLKANKVHSHDWMVGRTGPEDIQVNPYLGYACQVNYMEETPDGSLRHPSFEKFRGTEADPFTKM